MKSRPPSDWPKFSRVESDDGPSFSMEQVRALAERPLEHTLAPMLKVTAEMLARMHFAVLTTDATPGFVMSDAPMVVEDPIAHTRPPIHRSPGFGDKLVGVSLPLTPHRLLFLSWQQIAPRGACYVPVRPRLVDEATDERSSTLTGTSLGATARPATNGSIRASATRRSGEPPKALDASERRLALRRLLRLRICGLRPFHCFHPCS